MCDLEKKKGRGLSLIPYSAPSKASSRPKMSQPRSLTSDCST